MVWECKLNLNLKLIIFIKQINYSDFIAINQQEEN